MHPILGKRAFVPSRFLLPNTQRKARKALKFTELTTTRMSTILKEYASTLEDSTETNAGMHISEETVTVNEYVTVRGGVSVPRAWAMENLDLPWKDNTVSPKHGIDIDTSAIGPRDEQQARFFSALMAEANKRGPQDILANAATGSGKTVAGIYMGLQLGYRTLIVVDSNKIANGWLKNFHKFMGEEWTDKYVGRVQQDKCEYEGKAFSIALAQSLSRRTYPRKFYRAFGFVCVDEVQVFGGPHFAPILHMFPCRVMTGFTAENRAGSFGKRIKTHLGDTRVKSSQEVLKPKAWLLENVLKDTFWCYSDGALLTNLSKVSERNAKLAGLITDRGYHRGRNVLVLSNRTAQLVHLRKRCIELGVPAEAMGLHMGEYLSDRFVVYYKYQGSNKRNRLFVAESSYYANKARKALEGGKYEGYDLPKPLYNRLQAGEAVAWETEREKFKPTQSDLDDITNSCQIIFATYEIFSKGVDVPRLDMGVEALPSGNLKQPLGRILRLSENKLQPEWYAVCDAVHEADFEGIPDKAQEAYLLNEFFEGKTNSRITALRKAKAQIKRQ